MKKLYSNTLMQLILALCTFSFVACQEFDIDSQPEGPLNIQIDALESYTALATSPSNVVFNISSNTPWTIESDQQWCKPTPSMSAASSLVSEIVVTMENNTGKKARTAKLTIKAEGVEGTKVVTIEQASKEDLVVIPYDQIVPTVGGTISFNIVSNKPFQIIPSTQFVEQISPASGDGNEDGNKIPITITIPENTGGVRTAEITIKTEFQEKSFTITQDGIIIEPKNEEEKTNQLNGMGGEKNIEINSSVEWKVEVPAEFKEWLSAEADGNNLTLKAGYNNLFITRVGHVLLYPKSNVPGFEGVPVEVRQPRNMWADGAEDIDPETGYATIRSNAQNRYVPNFSYGKGKIVWNFESVNMPAGTDGFLYLNGDTWHWNGAANGAGWIQIRIYPQDSTTKSSFKLHYDWTAEEFTLEESMNDIKTIELDTKVDPEDATKVNVTFSINGKVYYSGKKHNAFDLDGHKGVIFYSGFSGPFSPECTIVFKSLDYEVYE